MRRYNPGPAFRKTSPWNPQRKHPVTGKVQPHRGEDWAAPSGTPIPAAAYGAVVFKEFIRGYGNTVVLEHETHDGEIIHTLYAHMRRPSSLKYGDVVHATDAVGEVGNTGIGTGPHLHFEVIPNGSKGKPNLQRGHLTINPADYDLSQLKDDQNEEEGTEEDKSLEFPSPFKNDWLIGNKDGKNGRGVIGPAFDYAPTSLDISACDITVFSYGAPHELRWFQPEAD